MGVAGPREVGEGKPVPPKAAVGLGLFLSVRGAPGGLYLASHSQRTPGCGCCQSGQRRDKQCGPGGSKGEQSWSAWMELSGQGACMDQVGGPLSHRGGRGRGGTG